MLAGLSSALRRAPCEALARPLAAASAHCAPGFLASAAPPCRASRGPATPGGAAAALSAAALAGALAAGAVSCKETAPEPGGRGFAGSVVVITGAAGDFGKAGAAALKREGAHVVLWDAAPEALKRAEEALSAVPGPKAIAIVCDVTSQAGVDEAVAATERAFGRITHLWNNAGYQGAVVPTLEYDIADFQRVQDVNVVGAFRVLQAVSKSMQKTGGGVIVNTASVAALRGTPAMPAYVASKAALLGMTMSVAKDLAPHGIRVNALSPALIGPGFMWDRQNQLHAASGSPYFARDPEVVAKGKLGGVPLKRLGSVDEVIKAVMFLLSEESSYCCGTNLIIDGGLAMR